MSSKDTTPKSQTEQTHSSFNEYDELSFIDFLNILIRKKHLITATTFIFALLSTTYVNIATPVYEAGIAFQEPVETYYKKIPKEITDQIPKQIDGKNDTFLKFLSQISSFAFQKKAFEEGDFLKKFYKENTTDLNQAVLALHQSVVIEKAKPDGSLPSFDRPIYLKMKSHKPDVLEEYLTLLANLVKQNIIEDTINLIRSTVQSEVKKLSSEINKLIISEKEERSQKVASLTEAMKVARKLGIKNNNFDKRNLNFNIFMVEDLMVEDLSKLPIWYLYGEKALQEEIELLTQQENKAKVIAGVATREAKLKAYKNIDFDHLKPNVVIISQPGIASNIPVSPKKAKIILISSTFGLLVGIIAAFIITFVSNYEGKKKL